MDEAIVETIGVHVGSRSRAEAFRALAEHHLPADYRLARAILRDPIEAEDATHDAYLAAWQHWATLRDPGRFEHWFRRILVNTCRNRLKKLARQHVRDISLELADRGADGRSEVEDRLLIGRAFAGLRPDDRLILALRFYRDLTVDEIADALGLPSGTVKSRLHRALGRLHAALDSADVTQVLR